MNQFITFVKKEFYHISRDKWSALILLLLPIVILLLFGFIMTTEVKNTNFVIYDTEMSSDSKAISQMFIANDYFIYLGNASSTQEIDAKFKKGEIKMSLLFSKGAIEVITDGSDPNSASTITMYANRIVAMYYQSKMESSGVMPQEKSAQIIPEVRLLYNPALKGAYNFVPGVMGMVLMLICAMMTSVSIAGEKERGTMEVLLVSPMKPEVLIISKLIPYLIISAINLITILLIAVVIMGVPIKGSIILLSLLSILFIIVSLSMGLLISTIVDSQMVALLISGMVLMLPVIMLSGMLFPPEGMPLFLRMLSKIIPASWYILATKKIMLMGVGFSQVAKEFAVLTFMAVALLSAGIKNFKHRLE